MIEEMISRLVWGGKITFLTHSLFGFIIGFSLSYFALRKRVEDLLLKVTVSVVIGIVASFVFLALLPVLLP